SFTFLDVLEFPHMMHFKFTCFSTHFTVSCFQPVYKTCSHFGVIIIGEFVKVSLLGFNLPPEATLVKSSEPHFTFLVRVVHVKHTVFLVLSTDVGYSSPVLTRKGFVHTVFHDVAHGIDDTAVQSNRIVVIETYKLSVIFA